MAFPSNNLPAHLPTLIGREEAVTTVRERLLQAEPGLVTLTGTGGTGKTRLALAVAGSLLDDFADGVWVVERASISDPALVASAGAGEVSSGLPVRRTCPGCPAYVRID